jgi:hypothetical protein
MKARGTITSMTSLELQAESLTCEVLEASGVTMTPMPSIEIQPDDDLDLGYTASLCGENARTCVPLYRGGVLVLLIIISYVIDIASMLDFTNSRNK